MEIIGRPADFQKLDPAVKRFLDSAWSTPSTDPSTAGFRRRNQTFPDQWEIMNGAALALTREIKEARVVYQCDPAPTGYAFTQFVLDKNKPHRISRTLVEIWNHGRDLGTCQNCGNLFSPRKGRTAKFCSARCKLQAARSA